MDFCKPPDPFGIEQQAALATAFLTCHHHFKFTVDPIQCPACHKAVEVLCVYYGLACTTTWLTAKFREVVRNHPNWFVDLTDWPIEMHKEWVPNV